MTDKIHITVQRTARTLVCMRYILFIRWLELLFVSVGTQKSTILTNFCNPEIPGLRCCQSQDSRLVRTARIRDPGIALTSNH